MFTGFHGLKSDFFLKVRKTGEEETFTADGVATERGLHMSGNSTIQYITEAKMNETLALLPK